MSTPDSQIRMPADTGRGLGRVVVAVLEILRDLLERQAIRRMESGSLTPEEVERLGRSLIALDHQLTEIRETLNTERILSP
jgi:hypothetical protein